MLRIEHRYAFSPGVDMVYLSYHYTITSIPAPLLRAAPARIPPMTTIALFGAGGKMGVRLSQNLLGSRL